MRLRSLLIALAPVLLVVAGCAAKKLNESAKLTLDKEYGARALDIPAQKKATTVSVEFASSDGEVSVLVFKETDVPKTPDDEALITVSASKAIVRKRGKGETFTAELPEGTAVRVVVREHTAAKTDVTLKVVGQ